MKKYIFTNVPIESKSKYKIRVVRMIRRIFKFKIKVEVEIGMCLKKRGRTVMSPSLFH